MHSLPIVPFRQRREGAHSLIVPRRRGIGPSELGVELIRGHPENSKVKALSRTFGENM